MAPDLQSARVTNTLERLRSVVESGSYSSYRVSRSDGGPFCQSVERQLERMFEVKHAILCTSATAGLYMALRAVGVGITDHVFVPGYTMSGSAGAILACGATPILVDVDPTTGRLGPTTFLEACKEYDGVPSPAALMLVNIHAGVHNTQVYKHIADIPVIEDCAQAFFCRSPETHILAGTTSAAGVLSFKQGKVLSCGEGGAILTNDDSIFSRLILIRNHGEIKSNELFGFNFHMTELQAAVLDAELVLIGDKLSRRQRWATALVKRLRGYKEYSPMPVDNAPFIFYMLTSPQHAVPKGFTRGYHTPLCCLPYFKRELRTSCLIGAHCFNTAMIWTQPPESADDVERIEAAVKEASDA